jgi:hypothetical protein
VTKSESVECKRKSVNLYFFLPPTLEAQFQSPKMLGKGKNKGLEQGPIYWKIHPGRGGRISADVILGKKYEKAKRKRGKM